MKKILLIVFGFFIMGLAFSQEAYICLPSKKTGFAFNLSSKSWEQVNFKTNEEKKALLKVNVDPFYIPKDENDKTIVFESRLRTGSSFGSY